MLWTVISLIIVGLIAGLIAHAIIPGKQRESRGTGSGDGRGIRTDAAVSA